jgi:hypothetical protein
MARKHSRVAHGKVDLPERAVVAVDRLAVAEARRRDADGLAARGQLGVELAHQALDRARVLERLLGVRLVAVVQRARGAFQSPPQPAEDRLRGTRYGQLGVG